MFETINFLHNENQKLKKNIESIKNKKGYTEFLNKILEEQNKTLKNENLYLMQFKNDVKDVRNFLKKQNKKTKDKIMTSELKLKILKAFTKGEISSDDFPNVTKANFKKAIAEIKKDLFRLFPNMKDKNPFPYNKKTKKYKSLIRITAEKGVLNE